MTGKVQVQAGAKPTMNPSHANSFRIEAVAQRLVAHLQFGTTGSNNTEFFGLCLSLARGIDYAVANNEVPSKAPEIPSLVKQVCQRRNDLFLQAAIMVLMISVKNACNIGWFKAADTEELFALANEIGNSFSSPGGMTTALGDSIFVMRRVMSSFYPLLKVGHILASLEVKPGYGAYLVDFNISKNTTHSPQEKIRLFVAQRDNIETSACIITPQNVNFLLNGKGVERRTNVSMDTGPQIPTNVTSMLKYGTNLLQAVGQFDGHYIILVAFMSLMPLSDTPELLDYIQPSVAMADPDSDIIEGPSRVSLHCPISYTRIRLPVKGHSCKHLQCFDFRNYVDINLRRPSWRCPHCNQYVSYTDIRADQNMVKVLKEVGENVSDVMISADGSWNVLESDSTDKENANCQKDVPEQQEPASLSVSPRVLDLTEDDVDDAMDVTTTSVAEDRKPYQTQAAAANLTMPSLAVNQNVANQPLDDFWSGLHLSGLFPETTNSVSSALNRDVGSQGNNNFTSLMLNHLSASGNSQPQQSQLVNNIEYGMLRQVPTNVSRNPIAIQALPALQTPVQPPRPRTNLSSPMIPNGLALTSQASLSRPHTNLLQSSPSLHQNLQQQQAVRLAQAVSQSPGVARPSPALQRSQTQQGVAHLGAGNANAAGYLNRLNSVAQQPVQLTRQPPSVPVQIQTSRGTSYSNTDGTRTPQVNPSTEPVNLSSEQNWRPTGRMRGSLSGHAAAAYRDLIIQPTQPSQAQLPQANVTSPPNVPPNLQAFFASRRNFYASHGQPSPATQPEQR